MIRSAAGRTTAIAVAFAIVLALAIVASLAIGRQPLTPAEVLAGLVGDPSGSAADIVRGLRLPRTVVALAIGAALGGAGAVAQALTRNPLADPGLLGVNAGAAAAVVGGFAVLGIADRFAQLWLALAGAAIAAVAVYALGQGGRAGASPARLALAGAALTAVLTAGISALALSDQSDYDQYRFWIVGSVVNRGLDVLAAAAPFLALGGLLAVVAAPGLNALALGEDRGRSVGLRVGRTRVVSALAVTLLAGGATAVAGPIGFVGLAVPHLVRLLVGPDQRRAIPLSMLLGAALLVVADTIGRVLGDGREIEAGLMTALLGAPVFIALVRRRRLVAL